MTLNSPSVSCKTPDCSNQPTRRYILYIFRYVPKYGFQQYKWPPHRHCHVIPIWVQQWLTMRVFVSVKSLNYQSWRNWTLITQNNFNQPTYSVICIPVSTKCVATFSALGGETVHDMCRHSPVIVTEGARLNCKNWPFIKCSKQSAKVEMQLNVI